MEDRLLSIGETAKLLDVCENTLRDWDIEGKLKATRTAGGHRRYDLTDIRLYIDKNPPKSNTKSFAANVPSYDSKSLLAVWEPSGYLEGLEGREKEIMAILLDNTRLAWELSHDPVLSSNQAIWLMHQAWTRCQFKKMVSVQPMLGPTALVYFLKERKGNLVLESEPVAACTSQYDFKIFNKGNFESLKEVYADCLALNLDNYIFDHLEKTDFDILKDMVATGSISLKNSCDYVIVPENNKYDLKDSPALEGVDVYEIPLVIDAKTFLGLAVMGRYPTSYLTLPAFCPYVMLIEGPRLRNGTSGMMFRCGCLPKEDSKS